MECFLRLRAWEKKTAERIVVELKDKVLPKSETTASSQVSVSGSEELSSEIPVEFATYQDAVSALLTLGYKATDADLAVRKASEILGGKPTTEELIRKALGR